MKKFLFALFIALAAFGLPLLLKAEPAAQVVQAATEGVAKVAPGLFTRGLNGIKSLISGGLDGLEGKTTYSLNPIGFVRRIPSFIDNNPRISLVAMITFLTYLWWQDEAAETNSASSTLNYFHIDPQTIKDFATNYRGWIPFRQDSHLLYLAERYQKHYNTHPQSIIRCMKIIRDMKKYVGGSLIQSLLSFAPTTAKNWRW